MSAFELKAEAIRRIDAAERNATAALVEDASGDVLVIGRRQGEVVGLRTARLLIEDAHKAIHGGIDV